MSRSDLRVQIKNLSAQPGLSRLAWSGDAVLKSKGNLTALSQEECFYFIALKDSIYADRPSFPAQRLSSSNDVHDLRWEIPSSGNQAMKGFHNRRYPHGINHLEIGNLGNQEMIICVCDDGDVVAYYTNSVKRAFEAIDMGISQGHAIESHIRPCFVYNVGMSAWGVAMQQEARLIAVSSNDHAIHINAPALCTGRDCPAEHQSSIIPEITVPGDTKPLDRSQGFSWKLRAHSANIPSVSFHISTQDNVTVYLVSSDIDYNIWVWNISQGSQLVHHIAPDSVDNSRQYGWLALPLSLNDFRLVRNCLDLNGFASELDCIEEAVVTSDQIHSNLARLPFPILHTRSQQLSLLINNGPEPHVSYQSPWRDHERGPPFEGPYMDYGTFKYARQIPELGIVVVASDAGYVGIFTLTRLLTSDDREPNGPQVGMRLDHILPFDEQAPQGVHDLRGTTLWSGLIGLATAPMQGTRQRSYRIILEYGDRTVLSYEIMRSETA